MIQNDNSLKQKTDYLLGVISDTHGLVRPSIYSSFQGVDAILHAGDLDRAEILDELKLIAPVIAVRGNMDQGRWADPLPGQKILAVGKLLIGMTHNIHSLELDPSLGPIRVVISGHTHQPQINEHAGALFLNPGSAGPKRRDYPISAALLKIHDNSPTATLIHLDL